MATKSNDSGDFTHASSPTDSLISEAQAAVAATQDSHALNNLKARFLGKSSALQQRLRAIGKLPADERGAVGAQLNVIRQQLEELFRQGQARIERAGIEARMADESLDVTLPGRSVAFGGAAHPLQQTIERAVQILSRIGFEVAEGPEIESDYYNFTALNFPPDHPARDMHDTLYLQKHGWLLRTHTSPVQVRHMEQRAAGIDKIPIRAISPGKVFRCDSDATHSPMFHQIEGLWVDKEVTFTDLKGVLGDFFRAFFEDDDIIIRFRPSFFPFTEPSAECDIRRGGASDSGDDWLEVAGCGMVHPNVLEYAKIDAARYQGFAFGMGVERLAMLYHNISDIRLFFENDLRFLAQFR